MNIKLNPLPVVEKKYPFLGVKIKGDNQGRVVLSLTTALVLC